MKINGLRRGKKMFRKPLVLIVLTAMVIFCVTGCKKDSGESGASQQSVKTAAEYEAEAKEQINKENMDRELDDLEKTLEQEISQEQ